MEIPNNSYLADSTDLKEINNVFHELIEY